VKDAPTLLLVYAALFAYAAALERDVPRLALLGALLTGIGFATKVNAIWPPAFFALALLASRRGRAFGVPWRSALVAMPFVAAAAYLLASPQYHLDGIERLTTHVRYALFDSTRAAGREGFDAEPLLNLWRVSPLPLLPLAALGVFVTWRRRTFEPTTFALFLLVALVPIVRPCLPGMRYFNLIRHSLEVLPALAAFAAIGAFALIDGMLAAVRDRRLALALTTLLAATVALPFLSAVLATHPYSTTYFNPLVGGLRGAQAARIADADDYWCQSSREAARWLAANAEPGALILDPFAPWMIGSLAGVILRDDQKFVAGDAAVELLVENGLLDENRDPAPWAAAPVVWITYVPQTRRFNQRESARTRILRYCETRLTPHHVIRSQGGEIVRFYRLTTTQ
jgi:hypothetical protein